MSRADVVRLLLVAGAATILVAVILSALRLLRVLDLTPLGPSGLFVAGVALLLVARRLHQP